MAGVAPATLGGSGLGANSGLGTATVRVHVPAADIADPAPLGLASFALTTFLLSAHNAGWAPDVIWVGCALFYGGIAQLLAGMWEFRKNNTFGATAFSTYGAFWLSLGIFVVFSLTGIVPAAVPTLYSLGWFIAAFFIFNSYMVVCALLVSKAVFMVFLTLEVTLACLFIGFFSNEPAGNHVSWTTAGGYWGIFTACAAWYASFAGTFNATAKRRVIPVGAPILRLATAAERDAYRNDDEIKDEV